MTKLNFNHFKVRSLQKGCEETEEITLDVFKELLKERIKSTKIELVLQDVRPFINNQAE